MIDVPTPVAQHRSLEGHHQTPSNSLTKQVGDFSMYLSRDYAVFLVPDTSLVYDLVHTSPFVGNELALGMSGMVVVEDDYNTPSTRQTRTTAPRSFPTRDLPTTRLSNAYYPSKCHVNYSSIGC